MKRIFPVTLFLMLLSFVSNGQTDTLVYKTGEKVAVRVDSLSSDAIYYKAPTGTEHFAISKSQIRYIKYDKYRVSIISPLEIKKKDSINKSFIYVYGGMGISLKNSNTDYSKNTIINFSSCKNYGAVLEYAISHSHFGVAAEFNYSYNPFDFNNFLSSNNITNGFTIQSENTPYFKIYSLLGGGFWEVSSGEVSFITRLLAGYTNFQSPAIQYSGYSYLQTASYYTSTQQSFIVMQKNAPMLSFDWGVSLKLKIFRRLYGSFSIDYFLTNGWINTNETETSTYTTSSSLAADNQWTTTTTYNPSSNTTSYNYHIPENMFDFSIGLAYSL